MPEQPSQEMIEVFEQLSSHIASKCSGQKPPESCCNRHLCEYARAFSKEAFGIDLEDTGAAIPFLTPDGSCNVAAHLRPLCFAQVCPAHYKDLEWAERYFELRDKAENILMKMLL